MVSAMVLAKVNVNGLVVVDRYFRSFLWDVNKEKRNFEAATRGFRKRCVDESINMVAPRAQSEGRTNSAKSNNFFLFY